jgi:DNA-directed RNA polymerase subunit RPC12/RpoP
MIVCANCNRAMRPKKNGVSFTEMAQDRPYKLWMADLWQCQDCGAKVLYTAPMQKPIAESFQQEFTAKLANYAPEYQAKEWSRT